MLYIKMLCKTEIEYMTQVTKISDPPINVDVYLHEDNSVVAQSITELTNNIPSNSGIEAKLTELTNNIPSNSGIEAKLTELTNNIPSNSGIEAQLTKQADIFGSIAESIQVSLQPDYTIVTISIISVVIALIALTISILETRRAREDNKVSRLPMLKVFLGTEEGGFISFGIENEGNGAGFIEEFELLVNGKVTEFHMLFTNVFGEGREFISKRLLHAPPKIIQANTKEELFRIADAGSNPLTDTQLMHVFATKVGVNLKSRPLKSTDERNSIMLPTIAVKSDRGFGTKV